MLLMFDHDIGNAIMEVCDKDYDSDGLILAKAAKIIRKDVFQMKHVFKGMFRENCQEESVPLFLVALVNMLLDGSSLADQSESYQHRTTASLTLSQLLSYNMVKSRSHDPTSSPKQRQTRDRETPVPIYLALKVHAETRKKGLVDTFHNLGLCISYDRLLGMSTDIANSLTAL